MINRFKIMLLAGGLLLSSSTGFAMKFLFVGDMPAFYGLPSDRERFIRDVRQRLPPLDDINQRARQEANRMAMREMERSNQQHQDNQMAMQRLERANQIAMQETEGYMRRAIMQKAAKIMAMILERSKIQNQLTSKEHQ